MALITSLITEQEALNEFKLFKKKDKEKKESKKYAPLTKDEANKILSICKSCLSKCKPELKKSIRFDDYQETMTNHCSKSEVTDDDYITYANGTFWDGYEVLRGDDSRIEEAGEDYQAYVKDIESKLKETGIKCKLDPYCGDWDDIFMDVYSRKPLIDSVNESTEEDETLQEGVGSIVGILLAPYLMIAFYLLLITLYYHSKEKKQEKDFNEFIKRNPKAQAQFKKLVTAIQDTLKKNIKSKALIRLYEDIKYKDYKIKDNIISKTIAVISSQEISKELDIPYDYEAEDFGVGFDFDTFENYNISTGKYDEYNKTKKNTAKINAEITKIIDQVNQVTKAIHEQPNGNLINLHIERKDMHEGDCIEIYPAYIILEVKATDLKNLEETKEVKAMLKKLHEEGIIDNSAIETITEAPKALREEFSKVKEIAKKVLKQAKEKYPRCNFKYTPKEEDNQLTILEGSPIDMFDEKNETWYDFVPKFNEILGYITRELEHEVDKAKLSGKISDEGDRHGWDVYYISGLKSTNEAFGLSKKEKAQKKQLSDIEFAYDKKYNGFCLSVSGYSIDKLESMLEKQNSDLEKAKAELKSANNSYDKNVARIKIDYFKNTVTKLNAMIKKKKSYKK